MSIYPSLEDMVVDHMMTAQSANAPVWQNPAMNNQSAPASSSAGTILYPGLGPYMGLELTEGEIRYNMPHYLPYSGVAGPASNSGSSNGSAIQLPMPSMTRGYGSGGSNSGLVAPLSSNSVPQLSHGVRQIILCKDGSGKVGLRVKSIDKGIFVCLVTKSSPAALGGIRFGDQILQINGDNVAGYSAEKVHDIFKKAGVNNIVLAVRDRPFERCLTLHKDSTGHLGFQFKDGKINSIVVNSSAARNGLLIEHNLLEVDGQNVVGMKDKEIRKIIDEGSPTLSVTVIPSYIFRHMMKNMSDSIVQKLMDHSTQEI
ncbi:syntenin-1 [Lepeophtheirus salmonis]|uniref:syntenin-1 n=1 Tax=Lepeophtheirus salmonis TaxID=72036 RepID=UPI001AE9EE4C|nr:syntenin-1-like [Lepeophtheirus salmonis]